MNSGRHFSVSNCPFLAFAGIPFNSHRYPDPQNDKAEAQQEKANATATTDTTLVATGGGRTINSTSAKKKGKEGGTSRPGGTSKVKAPGRRTRPLVCIPSEGPGGFFSLVRIGKLHHLHCDWCQLTREAGNANSHISPSETGGLRGHGRRAAQQAGEKNKR